MSGICGSISLDGRPADPTVLAAMTRVLQTRGPEGAHHWADGPVAMGHTLLATTPELRYESQPLRDSASNCVITADLRLDNRDELLRNLGLVDRAAATGDAALVVAAYQRWGEGCVARLLGDFAFALWDGGAQRLLLARDHFGMRPLFWHHAPGRMVLFASEPEAILQEPRVPRTLDEGRLADFIVPALEWCDHTSTCYTAVQAVAPGSYVVVGADAPPRVSQYWRAEPMSPLHLANDRAYADGLEQVLRQAIAARLRGVESLAGCMLSGGIDTACVAWFANEAPRVRPLPTFSALNASRDVLSETTGVLANIHAAAVDPVLVTCAPPGTAHPAVDVKVQWPILSQLSTRLHEPFDSRAVLQAALYEAAAARGVRVVLDGAAADTVLSERMYYQWAFRAGAWGTAVRGVLARRHFDEGPRRPVMDLAADLARLAWHGALPRSVLAAAAARMRARRMHADINGSGIRPEFAQAVNLAARFERLADTFRNPDARSFWTDRAHDLQAQVGRGVARYGRVAALFGVEARNPFLDKRVVEYCLSLPGDQLVRDGMPKAILRRVMHGRLPEAVLGVRARRGHLGSEFSAAHLVRESAGDSGWAAAQRATVSALYNPSHFVDPTSDVSRDAVNLARWLSVRKR